MIDKYNCTWSVGCDVYQQIDNGSCIANAGNDMEIFTDLFNINDTVLLGSYPAYFTTESPVTFDWQFYTATNDSLVSSNLLVDDASKENPMLINTFTEKVYAVLEVIDNSGFICSDTLEIDFKTYNAQNELSLNQKLIKIQRNPFSQELNFKSPLANAQKSTFEIIDLNGQVIYSGKVEESNSINTSNWLTGIYFLNIYTNKVLIAKEKIVKQ